jgi:ubiquinone biosynthesis protein COQ4
MAAGLRKRELWKSEQFLSFSARGGSMTDSPHRYSARPTRNPFRYLLALWRLTRDLSATDEAAIVEIGFARSRLGRRFARWEAVQAELAADPRTAASLARQTRLGPIDLDALGRLPEGTLGRVFADHCRRRKLDPNLVRVPLERPGDEVVAHLFDTHDLWHVTTGWGNDELGEVGLGGFYLAQLGLDIFGFLLALVLLNSVFFARGTLRPRVEAFVAGYGMGRRAEPLFGVEWDALWNVPLVRVRERLGLDASGILGEGIRAAA